uniref:Auxin-responsive protein n=1 Tax=Lycoris longituba TaxID=272140 RepID=D6MK69_9ASPA
MAMVAGEREMAFEATELRLGLPGSGEAKNLGKRGFSETIDLKLKLETNAADPGKVAGGAEGMKRAPSHKNLVPVANDPTKPSAPKAQVVGWPPVRSFRKNIMSVQSDKGSKDESGKNPAAFVKVSMDGAPYLRKVDLKMYQSYQELYMALEKMFSSFTIGSCGSQE